MLLGISQCCDVDDRHSAVSAQETIDFSRDILPVFADNCFACHGPDAATREGGFRLDERASAFWRSRLGRGIRLCPAMSGPANCCVDSVPPTTANKCLRRTKKKQPSTEQIELLERWIAEGAKWKEHWAFISPQRPRITRRPKQIVGSQPDQLLCAGQTGNHRKKAPSGEANKTILVRRVFLDLIGLPPTPEQVDEFLQDESPDAYEKLVDRLLESPHYGEHMATFWLDAARFAEHQRLPKRFSPQHVVVA